MKKVLLFLTMLVAMLPAFLRAQDSLVIGTGTSTNYYPIPGFYGWQYDVYIYTPDAAQELGNDFNVSQISYYITSSSSSTGATMTIWMKDVDPGFTLAGSNTFAQLTAGATQVYSNSNFTSTTGWNDYQFSQPFTHQGGKSILVAVLGTGCSNTGGCSRNCRYTTATGTHWYIHQDNSDPGTSATGTIDNYRANIKIEYTTGVITCPAISNLAATNITDQSADIEWSPRGTETSWDVYQTSSSTDIPDENTTPTDVATDSTYALSGLSEQTTYYVYVRANCGSGDVSRWRSVTFTTSQTPCQLPYLCDFEDPSTNEKWTLANGTQTNKWYIGPAVNNTDNGSNALYISNDNGTTNAYSHTTSYVYAYRDVDFTQGAAAYQIDFDWRNQGESASYDYLRVYIGDPVPVTAGSSIPSAAHATQIGNYYGQSTWQHASIALTSEYAGNKRLYFYWYNDGSAGSNPPAAVDNLSITALTCGFPTSFAIDTITSINATFHWHPATDNDNAWEVAVAPYGTSVDSVTFVSVNDTTYDAQGLNSNTRYVVYVRTDCGMGDVSSAISADFRTACPATNDVPIVEDFEAYGSSVIPFCWTKISSYSTYPYISSTAAHTGVYGMYFYNTTYNSGTYSYLAAPAIDPSVDLTGLTVRFDMRKTNDNVMATLGLMSDPTDTSTFTALYPISLTTSWDEYEFPLNNVTATSRHIAIKTELAPNASGTNGYIYMDNFNVNYTPNCMRVIVVSVDPASILSDGATITWVPAPGGSSWDVQVVPAGTSPSDDNWITVNDTTYDAQGLNANTEYTVYVRTNCGSEVSEPRSTNFRTACGTQTIPYFDNFESYTSSSSSFPACWTSIAGSSYVYSGSDSYGGSGKSLKIYGPGTVATPLIAYNVNELQISFQLNREGSSSGPMVLGFTTDLNNLSNMITIATIDPTETHTMKKYEYNLNNIGSTVQGYFVFQQQATVSNWYYWLDNIRIQEIPDCVYPVVNIASAGSDVITLNWNNDMDAISWNVVYSTSPINPDTVTTNVLNVTDTFVTIDNLTPGQIYYFYVQTDCGSGTSYFSEPVSAAPGVYKISDFASLTTCEGILCDDGGLNGDYGANRNDQIVLYPATPGAGIQVSGTVSTESGYDYLYIYEGVGTSGTLLFEGEGTMTVPPVMSATALTIVFTSDNIVFYDGFALNIECVDCVTPAPHVAQLGLDNAQITWNDQGGSPLGWEVAFGPAGFNINTVQPEYVPTNVYDALNLTNNTSYDVYVRALCNNGDTSSWSGVLQFTTLKALPAAIPYFCDFEDTTQSNEWTLLNGSCTNQWVIDTAVNNTANGAYSLYISNDNGLSNNYTINEYSLVWAYRDFNFTGYGEYILSFDWLGYGESCCDYIKVLIGSPATPTVGGDSYVAPENATDLFGTMNLSSSWGHKTITLNGAEISGTKRIYFGWRNDYSLGTSPAGAIDNVRIEGTNCVKPTNLHFVSSTNNSADVAWTPGSETDQAWDIVYSTQAGFNPDTVTAVTVNDTLETISNLNSGTVYYAYVRTNCGNNELSTWSNMITFQTECDMFTIPYFENFDNQATSSMPICWNSLGNYSTVPYVSTSYSSSSPNSLSMYSYGTTAYSMVSTPELDPTVNANALMVSFKMRAGSTSNQLIVGVLTDNEDVSTFVPVDTLQASVASVWEDQMVFLNNYTGAGHYIGFKLLSPSGYTTYLDDINIDYTPSCLPVTGISAVPGSTSVALSWTENGTATSWAIEYGPQGFTQGTGTQVTATTNPFTIDNLTAGTAYDFYVRANCGAGDESDWAGPVAAMPGSFNIPTTGEITLSLCGGTIYDDGGLNGNYSNSCNATVVINPDQAGLFVQLNGTYDIETGTSSRWDYLQIFDGSDNTGTILFDSHNGDALTNITSTTGPLTLYFHSDASVNHSGFEIQVSCVGDTTPVEPCNAPANVEVNNVTTSAATVDWTQEGTPDGWVISYKKGSANTWTTINTSTHPYTITNLEAETSYSVFVTAVCGEEESTPSNTVSFTTDPDGVNVYANSTIVYPNPTTGKFRIENSELSIENVEVYDVYGKLITTVKVEDNHVELDLSGNASGVYFTRIFTDKGMITKRIVKK